MTRHRSTWWLPLLFSALAVAYDALLESRVMTPVTVARGDVHVEALGTGSAESRRTFEIEDGELATDVVQAAGH